MALNDFSQVADVWGPKTFFRFPGSASVLSPVSYTKPKEIVVHQLPISRIPGAMRKMGWDVSAALMERWFRSEAWEMPASWKSSRTRPNWRYIAHAHFDSNIVKLAWARGFPRCEVACQKVLSMYASPRAKVEIRDLLTKAGWNDQDDFLLGYSSMHVRDFDECCSTNEQSFGAWKDTLDDMYGALGSAVARVGVIGYAYSENGRSFFQIERIGLYLRDFYDFNGPQFLGIWTNDRVLTKRETASVSLAQGEGDFIAWDDEELARINNSDFRKYRDIKGKGGDFLVYSDIAWHDVDQVIELPPLSAR